MRRSLLAALLGSAAVAASLAVGQAGCASSGSGAPPPPITCTPGAYVYCRCQNRDEGTKLCGPDGHSFGTCEPCETATNPVVPDPPGPPIDAAVAACGNGVVEDGEDCDDGNNVESDGCDSTCRIMGQNPAATRSCPGLPTHVWSRPVTYTGTTVGSTFRGSLSPSCNTTGTDPTSGAAGPDRVFDVVAHRTGSLKVSVSNTNYDALLYVTQQCVNAPAPISYLTCADGTVGVGGEALSAPVIAGQHYSVIVDGAGITVPEGAFLLTLSIQ